MFRSHSIQFLSMLSVSSFSFSSFLDFLRIAKLFIKKKKKESQTQMNADKKTNFKTNLLFLIAYVYFCTFHIISQKKKKLL